MGIRRKKKETLIRGWLFYTPNRKGAVWASSIEKACDLFQEKFGYYPDPRQAEPIYMKEEKKN